MKYVFLAGIGNSLNDHWQRQWYESLIDHSIWVEHHHWESPIAEDWIQDLNAATRAIHEPFIIIAHSLGGALFLDWAAKNKHAHLMAAFLVALPDSQSAAFPSNAVGFSTQALRPLSTPIRLVMSENDPYANADFIQQVGAQLNLEVMSVGTLGHINAESNIGQWPKGWQWLHEFVERVMTERAS